ncbi:hypothetical protein D9613_010214 [Agrocybe pediades]|uniref:Uncharacterized protein n=1 Tax=Agrocybe pediades TaxID=84607 RepID=A0A8H4QFE2_9AGAR|nr:hypothetical protein D9613_010214 [Agrocybe pediades]
MVVRTSWKSWPQLIEEEDGGHSGTSLPLVYRQALSSSSARQRQRRWVEEVPYVKFRPSVCIGHGFTTTSSSLVAQKDATRRASASQSVSPVRIASWHSAAGSSSNHSNYSSSVDHHYQHRQRCGLVPRTSDVDSNSRTYTPSFAASGSGNDLDPNQLRYRIACSPAELLKMVHCERDRRRFGELHSTIFSVQDEVPTRPGMHWSRNLPHLIGYASKVGLPRAKFCCLVRSATGIPGPRKSFAPSKLFQFRQPSDGVSGQ